MYKGKWMVRFESVPTIDDITDDTHKERQLWELKYAHYSGVSLEENQKEIQPRIPTLDRNMNPGFTEC